MRILHASDLNGRSQWLEWVAHESFNYDLVCLTGSLLKGDGPVWSERGEQLPTVVPFLQAIYPTLAVCSGHDDIVPANFGSADWLGRLRKKNVYVDGDSFWFRDYRFRCLAFGEKLPRPRGEDFWLVHSPPLGAETATEAGGASYGCPDLRTLCLSGLGPRCLLGGLVHRPVSFFSKVGGTISINTGQGEHPEVPNHVVIDLAEGTASHFRGTWSDIKETTLNFRI